MNVSKMWKNRQGCIRAKVSNNGVETEWEQRGPPRMWECLKGRSKTDVRGQRREYVQALDAYFRDWRSGQMRLF